MKLLRTVRTHERIVFGPDPDAELADQDPESLVTVDRAGLEVGGEGLSESAADEYVTRAAERGVELELVDRDAEDAPATPVAANTVAADVPVAPPVAPRPTPPGVSAGGNSTPDKVI